MNAFIPNITLLAIDPGLIALIAFILFSIVGGLQNLLKNQQKQPPNLGGRKQRRQPERQNDLQHEIDQFLEDVLGKDEVTAARREKEYREKERRRTEQRARRRQPAPTPASEPKREPLARHHLESSRQEGVAQHVAQHMRHLESDVPHLESGVANHVNQHLGASSDSITDTGSPAAREIFKMLGDSSGMRQAILINEILSPPKSMRNRPAS